MFTWGDWLVAALLGLLIALLAAAAIEDSRRWSKFVREHNCKVVGKISGDVLVTPVVGGNGQVGIGVTSTPDKTGYACDDGVTYWR